MFFTHRRYKILNYYYFFRLSYLTGLIETPYMIYHYFSPSQEPPPIVFTDYEVVK
jgi:hypothetical protein